MSPLRLIPLLVVLCWSCVPPPESPDGGADAGFDAGWGEPLAAVPGGWTWFDFPDSACDDGSPTGIGVALGSGPNVLLYLQGGGACWDPLTCYTLNSAKHGPFGAAQFASISDGGVGSVFDRSLPGNPFADWSFVYVPYCTGDLHAGQNVATYTVSGQPRLFHHVGHANVLAYLKRLAPTFATAEKVVLSGASAGGYGTIFNQPDVRAAFPNSRLYVLDDSGPLINGFPAGMLAAFRTQWRLDLLTDPMCGAACSTDLSQVYTSLATSYGDRTALLSSLQDKTIRGYAQMTAPQFQTALLSLESNVLRPLPNEHVFFVLGQTHTMLGSPAGFTQNGVALLPWLTQFVTDDPAWTSVLPP